MRKQNQPRSASITITSLTKKKGNGKGQYLVQDGTYREAEVPFTMPGDTVQALLWKKKSGTACGRLEQILTPAPNRQTPKCVHFGLCGGCRWQHMPYSEQLTVKENGVREQFASLLTNEVAFHSIVPCDPPWEYRNKMEFSFSSDAAGNRYLGMIMDSSRGKVFHLTDCHLVNSWFAEAVAVTREWWEETGVTAYHPPSNNGSLRTLIVREGMSSGDRLVMLTVSGNPDFALKKHQIAAFVENIKAKLTPQTPGSALSIFVRIQQIAKGMATQFYEMHMDGPDTIREELRIDLKGETVPLHFTISPSAFFQPNTRQAEKIYSLALQRVDIGPSSIVYDLYCGTGTLGICAATRAKQVIGIELSPESSLDARTNAKNNGIHNIEIVTGAVNEVIRRRQSENNLPKPDVIMVDPPRAGLGPEVIQQLLVIGAPKILYISCNPATQAEDVAALVAGGYQLKLVQPVDQFPQTVHVENIAVLEKI